MAQGKYLTHVITITHQFSYLRIISQLRDRLGISYRVPNQEACFLVN